MHRLAVSHTLMGLAAASLIWPYPTFAQDDDTSREDDPVQVQLRQMQEQLEALRNENQAMKGEIDELRAATNDDWLTEARADEIRGLVSEVLADADTRASMLQDGLMAGWSEHFFLADPSGRFKLEIDGAMQIRWIYNYLERVPFSGVDQHRQGFENTRTRLTFRGHVFSPDIQYLIRSDFSRTGQNGNNQLLDAWVRYSFSDEWSFRFGQFKLPFNREELVSPFEQLAVERSLVNETLNIGRSQGIELTYHDDVNRLAIATSDGASANPNLLGFLLGSQGTNTSAIASDIEYDVTARYENLLSGTWAQFDDFTSPQTDQSGVMWGIAIHAQESESDGVGFTQESRRDLGAAADISFEWGGANAFLGATYHYVDVPAQFQANGIWQFIGLVAQFGVYVTPKWELFVRGEYMQAENYSVDAGFFGLTTAIQIPDLNLVTVGANYYLEGHDLKWTTDLGIAISDVSGAFASDLAGYRPNGDNTAPQIVFRTQFQLLF